MRVAKPRWGEVTIKKQGSSKNRFDCTKSFSIIPSNYNYSIEEYLDVLKITTDLTDRFKPLELINKLKKCIKEGKNGG